MHTCFNTSPIFVRFCVVAVLTPLGGVQDVGRNVKGKRLVGILREGRTGDQEIKDLFRHRCRYSW